MDYKNDCRHLHHAHVEDDGTLEVSQNQPGWLCLSRARGGIRVISRYRWRHRGWFFLPSYLYLERQSETRRLWLPNDLLEGRGVDGEERGREVSSRACHASTRVRYSREWWKQTKPSYQSAKCSLPLDINPKLQLETTSAEQKVF